MQREFMGTLLAPMMRDHIVDYSVKDGVMFLRDGGRIVFLSGHNLEFIEQYTAAWAFADEASLMGRKLFMKLAGRIREAKAVRKRIAFAGTPGWGWIKDEFEGRNDKQRKIIHARTTDNPFLPPDYVSNLYSSCPARLARAYIEGQFVPPGGTVYAEFEEQRHVVDWQRRADMPVFVSIDWSPRVPHATFIQLLPEDTVIGGNRLRKLNSAHEWAGAVVIDEVVLDGVHSAITREQLLQEIVRRGHGPAFFVCDPAGGAVSSAGGSVTDIKMARQMLGIDAKIPRTFAQRSVLGGIAHVQNMFMPLDRVPRLYFARDMVKRAATLAQHVKGRASIYAVQGYSYPDDETSSQPVKNGVDDHFCDTIRYGIVMLFPADRVLSSIRQTA
jgi:hypothetical protein